MIELQFTKFFDVKSPLGITQNEKEIGCEFHSIGVDTYMPKPTNTFIDTILEKNKAKLIECHYDKNDIISEFVIKNSENDENLITYINGTYFITHDLNIPSGIGILIPKGYYIDYRSKSSNFNNDYTVINGLIDENFTYGMTVQLHKLNGKTVEIKPDEKFAQIILIKGEFIADMNEIKLSDWIELEQVQKRRINRKGGLGHSGKF
jgi:dUTPase